MSAAARNLRIWPLLLFPSIGEYLAYDDQAYDGFIAAGQRNTAYRQALGAASPGRVVLDIGTGRDALWAITAARAGARQVYAVEVQATVAAQAERAVRRAGLASLVRVITGRSQDIELPGQAGVRVAEIIGNIASAPHQRHGAQPSAAGRVLRQLRDPGLVEVHGQPADRGMARTRPITTPTRLPITTRESCTRPRSMGAGTHFPYDDVAPAGGADQSGAVSDPALALLTVTLGAVH